MFNRRLFRSSLKNFFESHIFSRGVDYYNDHCVADLKIFPGEDEKKIIIKGKVTGSDYYDASLFFDIKNNKFGALNCSCPYNDNCKHLAALGLEFIDVLEEFTQSNVFDFDNNFREKLFSWINKREKTPTYQENKTNSKFYDNEKENYENKILKKSNKKPTAYPPDKYNINNYYIVINTGYSGDISGLDIKNGKNSIISAEVFLNNCRDLSKKQKELLQLLKKHNFYYIRTDYKKLFSLLKESDLKIYWQGENKNSQLKFLPNSETKKIKISLNLDKIKYEYSGQTKKEFIFKLDESYKNKKIFSLFFDQNGLIMIDDYEVSFQEMPDCLIKILARINTKNDSYYYAGFNEHKKPFAAALNENEIIEINKIIKNCYQYFNFSSKLKPNFKITEFTETAPCLLIDYDGQKNTLEAKAAIDYEIEKINVSQSVCRSRSGGRDEFNRMGEAEYVIKINGPNIDYAPIKKEEEIELYKFFCYSGKEYGFKRNVECRWKGEAEVFSYFKKHWENVKNLGHKIIFVRDEFSIKQENFRADFTVDLNAENDWLWFDVNCYGGADKISLEDLKKYVENKKEFIKMSNGRLLKIANFEELERFVMMLESFYARERGGFEGKLYHAPELENIFTSSKYYNAKVQASFNEFIKEAKSGRPVRSVKLKPEFNKIMRSYQKEGMNWFYFLRQYRFAGILADDMGLGKTLQALVLMETEKKKNTPSIVVCPKSILYNWEAEAKKFAPNLKTAVIDGPPDERELTIKNGRAYDLIITGYAALKKDAEIYEKEKIKFNYCVLDEAQFIKNHTTKNARIAKKINAGYRLALTGTPLENNVSEIWSIFDFLMPGFLGSYKLFVKKFQKPIMKQNSATALNHLRKKVECFMLRRIKSEVLKELPPKIEQVSYCHLEQEQNILYQEILTNVKSEVFTAVRQKGFNQSRIHILAGLTKLRQVCNHPVLLLKNKSYADYESAKLNMFMELIDEIIGNKRKVLVFSQFTKMLDILAEELKNKKINYNYLSGQTKNRQELVDDFNGNSHKQIFLISTKAGGTGLNLTSADNVIIFDPWWNPSVENQAIDRAHRIGQKNSVNVYRLITLGTIEEKIVKLQDRKKFLFDNLVGESKDLFKKLTWEDVKELFK